MRFPDWPARLAAELDRHAGLAAEYGVSDCALLAVDCARAITGGDPLSAYRNYHSRFGSVRQLAKAKCRTVADLLGIAFPEIHPSRMGRGDLAAYRLPTGEIAAAVCIGADLLAKSSDGGLGRLSRRVAIRAFKVD